MKILVVVARGLQAVAVGCYGNRWIATPVLDSLAAEGVVFDRQLADAASPEGARRAWRTGCYGLPGAAAPVVPHGNLLELLREQKIPTSLVVDDSHPLDGELYDGWQKVRRVVASRKAGTPLEATLAAAQEQLKLLAAKPRWLLWVELACLLPPWETPAEFQAPYFEGGQPDDDNGDEEDDHGTEADAEELVPLTPLSDPPAGLIDARDDDCFLRLQTTYAAAVSYLDADLGQLLEALDELASADETLVMVLADCGQALGEHGAVGPVRPWLHEEIVHVPLIVRLPGRAEAGRRVAALTQAVDLLPTLAEAMQLPRPACHGHSLLPLALGQVEHVREYACSALQVGDALEWRLQTAEWAYVLPIRTHADDAPRAARLYAKPDDRWEVNDVLHHHAEVAERLDQTLRAFTAAAGSVPLEAPPLSANQL